MGKPYSSELERLTATYAWAMTTSIEPLAEAVAGSLSTPLLATGSGGSLTAAHFASWLHQRYAGRVGKAITPFELVSSTSGVKDVSLLMLSAGGGNPDIIGAFKHIVAKEPRRIIVVCSRTKSPLSRLAKSYRYVDLVDFDLPVRKDGFLATNSLLAFAVVLSRAWAAALSIELDLPQDLNSLVHPILSSEEFSANLANRAEQIWHRDTIGVLYGPTVHSAAIDFESKFTEAALGSVQIADYRNFAHGRHHWLAKHGKTTGLIAFVTDDDRQVANKTLALIPSDIPIARVDLPFEGLRAGLAALVTVFHLAGFAGTASGIDPGRPSVPQFGRRIYRLSTFGSIGATNHSLTRLEAAAIERKGRTSINILSGRGELGYWRDAYHAFIDKLQNARYGAVVFDYDGTLCDGRRRYKGMDDDVADHLTRLLTGGAIVAIATGRGRSVRKVCRSKLPKALWGQVLLGYYNGSENGLLNDDSHPNSADGSCKELLPVVDALDSDQMLERLSAYVAERSCRHNQITVQMKAFAPVELISEIVQQAVHRLNIAGVEVLYSTHSVDVIAPGVSKKAIVDQVRKMMKPSDSLSVLCIGDLGQWPGNDFALLSEPHSLSVDTVSSDPETCWNVAPPGHRGVQAALDYLASLNFADNALRFAMSA